MVVVVVVVIIIPVVLLITPKWCRRPANYLKRKRQAILSSEPHVRVVTQTLGFVRHVEHAKCKRIQELLAGAEEKPEGRGRMGTLVGEAAPPPLGFAIQNISRSDNNKTR